MRRRLHAGIYPAQSLEFLLPTALIELQSLMEFHLPHICVLLITVTLVVSHGHAALLPQHYWNILLPNSAIPESLSKLLPSDLMEEKSTNIGAPYKAPQGVGSWWYHYAATYDQIHRDPQVDVFFLEKNMRPGTKLNLHFTTSSNTATFIPRETAESIPFSSNRLPEIFDLFSVKPGSVEEHIIKQTFEQCEDPGIKGEGKICATSLESMVDFAASKLGSRNIQVPSTEFENGTAVQKYTILPGVKKLADERFVVCHKQNYPYAVFYCHTISDSRAYLVPLEGADGAKAKAVTICHTDTSEWNPRHLAFHILKIKPGNTIPICHFFPDDDHIIWVPDQDRSL